MSKVSDFIDKYTPYANRAASEIGGGTTAADILGLWGLERGWNDPSVEGGRNNLAGIKPGGRDNPLGGIFMNYTTVDDFVSDFIVQFRRLIGNREGNTFLDKAAKGAWEGYDVPANIEYSKRVGNAIKTVKGYLGNPDDIVIDLNKIPSGMGGVYTGNVSVTENVFGSITDTDRSQAYDRANAFDPPTGIPSIPTFSWDLIWKGLAGAWYKTRNVLLYIVLPILGVVLFAVVFSKIGPKAPQEVIIKKEE